jgi:hypothetical protein
MVNVGLGAVFWVLNQGYPEVNVGPPKPNKLIAISSLFNETLVLLILAAQNTY